MPKLIGFAIAACLFAQPSFAADNGGVVGTWKLVSSEVEVQATGVKGPAMGVNPTGYVAFLPGGRVFFILTAGDRKSAMTDQERAGLLNTLVAYTGTYRVQEDKWTTTVEVAWTPEWVGTEQARTFKIDGDRLEVSTPWRVMPDFANKGMTRSVVTFVRSKHQAYPDECVSVEICN